MSSLAITYRQAAPFRRVASVLLSILTVVLSIAILAVFVTRPSTFLGEGTFGLDPVRTALMESREVLPLAPIAALALLIGMQKRDASGRPVRRVPMAFGVAAAILCALTVVYPNVSVIIAALLSIVGFLVMNGAG
ncbi:hypothetical protein [Microbacterium sp. CIAB417]|uniref:hypothetical protein n=1 Tax=Microbacterium sp. CIAB417 TaxID=2860287 RepID=UPI001FAB50D4|nr:hypothetical protein [Microbacterium sp. CIAB417]